MGKYQTGKRPIRVCECGGHAWAVLTRGHATIVSPEDAAKLQGYNWSALVTKTKVAAVRRQHGEYIYMHRAITDAPADKVVDHANHDQLDNQRENLRLCTRGQNNCNQRAQKARSSRYKGVCFDASRGRWAAKIKHGGRIYVLGRFDSEDQAAFAYDAKALELHGEFAATNAALGLVAP